MINLCKQALRFHQNREQRVVKHIVINLETTKVHLRHYVRVRRCSPQMQVVHVEREHFGALLYRAQVNLRDLDHDQILILSLQNMLVLLLRLLVPVLFLFDHDELLIVFFFGFELLAQLFGHLRRNFDDFALLVLVNARHDVFGLVLLVLQLDLVGFIQTVNLQIGAAFALFLVSADDGAHIRKQALPLDFRDDLEGSLLLVEERDAKQGVRLLEIAPAEALRLTAPDYLWRLLCSCLANSDLQLRQSV